MRVISSWWIGWMVCAVAGCSSQPADEALETQAPALNLPSAEIGEPFETDPAVPALGRLGHGPRVAFDGENYAAVFEDQAQVHAVRIAPEGRVLELDWVAFEPEAPDALQLYPSLAYGGGKYLATWSESAGSGIRVRGQLFLRDATLDGGAFAISGDAASYPSATFDGTDFLVTYQTPGTGVSYCRVSTAGALIQGSEHAIDGTATALNAAVAHAGTLGLVVWPESGDSPRIRATRIAPGGTPMDTTPISIADGPGLAEVAVAGANGKLLVAYRSGTQIEARLIDATSVGPPLTLSPADSEAGLPAVAASGDGFVVAWADSRDELSIRGLRVSSTGEVLGEDELLANGKPRSVAISEPLSLTSGASELLVGFMGEGVQGSVFSPELVIENGDFPISAVQNAQGAQQVAWNGESYTITWIDERNGRDIEDMDARFVRIGPDGARLDPEGVVVAEAGTFSLAQVGGKAGSWLAAWYSSTDQSVFVRSVQGKTLGAPHELTTRDVATAPSLAFDGTSYLSVYAAFDKADVGGTYSMFGRPVAADGTPGTEFPIDSGLAQPPGVSVFAHGDGYVFASSLDRVTLRTVTATGTLGEPIPLQEGEAFLAAASNGEELLIASIDQSTQRVSARFFADGALRGESIPLADTSSGFLPAVAWDGESFLVVWDEDETRVPKARSITPAGSVSSVRALADAECYGPWLASDGAGQLLLSCVRYDAYYVRRIDSYFLSNAATPKVPPSGDDGGRAGSGGAAPSGGSAGGRPVTTAGSGGSSEPSTNGGAPDAGQPGMNDAGESGFAPGAGGSGGRVATGGSDGRAASAGQKATGGTADSPPPADDGEDDSGDDGGCSCSVGSDRHDASSAWLAACLALVLGVRRRRS